MWKAQAPLSLIVDRFWHLWWKYGAIRERGITLNFSPSLLSSWWCQRQCFLRCWRLCPMPGSQSWHQAPCAIGLENINQSPNLASAHCLPITGYKPTNNRKKTLSIFNEIGLIVISLHSLSPAGFCRVWRQMEFKYGLPSLELINYTEGAK